MANSNELTINEYIEKFKATITLGVTSNFSSIAGFVGCWIFLVKTEWITEFWKQIGVCIALLPIFLGDAINAYVLGRVRLDHQKGWNDVRISDRGRKFVINGFYLWRGISLISAIFLVLFLLSGFSSQTDKWRYYIGWSFLSTFILHSIRSQLFLFFFVVPVVPNISKGTFFKRLILIVGVAIPWLIWLMVRTPNEFSLLGLFVNASLYFILCGLLQPLPTKFSIFRLPKTQLVRKSILTIEPVSEESVSFFNDPNIEREIVIWNNLGFSKSLGTIRMPLLEIPVFHAVGKVFMHDSERHLLFFLNSEINKKTHRTLVSWVGNDIFVSSDFGSSGIEYPKNFRYEMLSKDTAAEAFWEFHKNRLSCEPDLIELPVWKRFDPYFADVHKVLKSEVNNKIMDSSSPT